MTCRFVGGNQFCFKACYNTLNGTAPTTDYCENRYDLVGCSYNMPSAAKDGEFTQCDGDVQDVVGVYTTGGQSAFYFNFQKFQRLFNCIYAALTWSMPDPLNTPPPYQPRVPSSSNCKTFQATDLFLAQTASVSFSMLFHLAFPC